MNDTPTWLNDQMTYHLTRLLLLHLNFSPQIENTDPLRDIWAETFINAIGRIDERLDGIRIEKAFTKFESQATVWPSPAVVIELMPRRPDQNMLPHDPRQHESEDCSMIVKMRETIFDLSEGRIDKEEFDRIMEQFGR